MLHHGELFGFGIFQCNPDKAIRTSNVVADFFYGYVAEFFSILVSDAINEHTIISLVDFFRNLLRGPRLRLRCSPYYLRLRFSSQPEPARYGYERNLVLINRYSG